MKKIIAIALLLLAGLSVSAQGRWTVSHREADPMKGQTEKDVYIYEINGVGSVVVWDWDKADFRLITEKGMFKDEYTTNGKMVPVKAGFYNKQGKMEKMVTVILFPEDNHNNKFIATGAFYYFGRGDIRKIISHMKKGKGYVRFVVQRYNDTDFDIIVTPYQQ